MHFSALQWHEAPVACAREEESSGSTGHDAAGRQARTRRAIEVRTLAVLLRTASARGDRKALPYRDWGACQAGSLANNGDPRINFWAQLKSSKVRGSLVHVFCDHYCALHLVDSSPP